MKRTIAIALCALLAAACASKAPTPTASADGGKKKFVVGYSQSNNAEPYRAQLNLQLQHFLERYPDIELLPIADAKQSSATQVSQVQNFITQKVDALIVSPTEPAPLTAAVQQACDAKIPVIILDRTVNTDCYTAFIGGDNVLIGRKAGEEAVKLLPDGGNIVELRGILSNQPQIDRDKGFREAIAANPKIKIIADREAKWVKEQATPIMQQWLAQHPKIDLVYGHNDPMALGAYLAAKAAGKAEQIKFIGIDGLAIPDGGIRAVQLGQLSATFIYPTGAQEAADTVNKILHGQPVDKQQVLGTTQVTKDNAADLYKQFDLSGQN
ncbi:monosaccharide ABC transporter substrate-binding protein (CUT2 family) [Nonomuraea polychroma]|uniref:Monosaccharide ABC transporter substrate-binding protein (CUT2 family) n=1 Tax=Nonomuraea polychroma TaxID=46176 RepID=A0A438M7L7_9ACTN|nr:substrate-binding domain-containing protein [Nonomuraea polychroma]RVX41605.1 monosaccharide ABC transporter substrate-binding protein (CUT2 family) [Nonomuraea polychroma]